MLQEHSPGPAGTEAQCCLAPRPLWALREEKGVGMASPGQVWVETDYRPAALNPQASLSQLSDLETPDPGYTHRSACPAMFYFPHTPAAREHTRPLFSSGHATILP